jgi:hypothetical protein
MRARRLLLVAALAALGACTSPEATRQRAGGPGADVGNRRDPIDLHAGADPYYRTPYTLPVPPETAAASPGSR